jgi:hypothetical protein
MSKSILIADLTRSLTLTLSITTAPSTYDVYKEASREVVCITSLVAHRVVGKLSKIQAGLWSFLSFCSQSQCGIELRFRRQIPSRTDRVLPAVPEQTYRNGRHDFCQGKSINLPTAIIEEKQAGGLVTQIGMLKQWWSQTACTTNTGEACLASATSQARLLPHTLCWWDYKFFVSFLALLSYAVDSLVSFITSGYSYLEIKIS